MVWPLLSLGFFSMHDDTQVGRVVAMGKALKDGQFPVRWVSDLGYGYGYPLFNFYGPLPYYLGGSLYVAGFSGLIATKTMIIVGMLFPVLTMFLFVRSITGLFIAALVASLLYGYAPYHAVELYVRGAVGELWTLGFYPLLAWGFFRKSIFLASTGLAGIILSHTLSGFVTVIFIVVSLGINWVFLLFKKQFHLSFIMYNLSFLFLGLALSAFFWLPAIAEMKFTDVAGQVSATANYRDHFVCLPQLWDSVWGFGGSASGCVDGLTFRLGKLSILLSVVSIFYLLFSKLKIGIQRIGWLGVVIGMGSLFLTLPISERAWGLSSFFAYFQYPWRFLAPAAFGMSIMGGVVFVFLRSRVVAIVVVVLLMITNGKLFRPQYIIDRPAEAYETDEELRWRVSKVSDEYLPQGFIKPKSGKEVPRGLVVNNGTSFSIQLTHTSNTDVTIDKAYFPGWQYRLNGVRVEPKISGGLPVITVSEGQNVIMGQLTDTPVRTIGNMVSFVSLFLLGGFLWVKNRQ